MNKIFIGNALDNLKKIPDLSVDCVVTSPPYYGLRDYNNKNQIGLENTLEEYVEKLVEIFRQVKRVLKNDGTIWLNIGDRYDTKKNLMGVPWRLAFELQKDGWYLRQEIIWHKPNPVPESVTDRCTSAHEKIFLLSKNKKYYFDNEAIKEPANYDNRKITTVTQKKYTDNNEFMPSKKKNTYKTLHERWTFKDGIALRNKRNVWTVPTRPYKDAHFATYPENLILPCILAGSRENGIVLDPFLGSGTTAVVALKNNRQYIGIELNNNFVKLAKKRIAGTIKEIKKEKNNEK